MAVTYFCPACWREIPPGVSACPVCKADLISEAARPFVEKLRRALNHPEPETAMRAAWILGERREQSGVDDLIRTLDKASDSFVVEAAAEALGKIRDPKARDSLCHAEARGPVRVRRAAGKALSRLLNSPDPTKNQPIARNPSQLSHSE